MKFQMIITHFMKENVELEQLIDKFGLAIYNLEANLCNMIEASHAQQPIIVYSSYGLEKFEEEPKSQVEESNMKFHLFDLLVVNDAEVVKTALESSKKIKNIIFEDSSVCISEDVITNMILELERIRTQSRHVSILVLGGDMRIDPSKPMEESEDEQQSAYTLMYIVPTTK